MLRFNISLFVLLTCLSIEILAQSPKAQVRISSELNGKMINSEELKIEIFAGKRKFTPRIVGSVFSINTSDLTLKNRQQFKLRINYRRYRLVFINLSKDHFQGLWKVFITTASFLDKPKSQNAKKIDYVYRIEFNSGNSIGVGISKVKYKN